jgi:hypothetical protein
MPTILLITGVSVGGILLYYLAVKPFFKALTNPTWDTESDVSKHPAGVAHLVQQIDKTQKSEIPEIPKQVIKKTASAGQQISAWLGI